MSSKTFGYRFARTTNNVRDLGTVGGSDKILDRALKSAIVEVAAVASGPAKIAELRTTATAAVARLAHLSATTAICLAGVADPGVAAAMVEYLLGEIRRSAVIPASLADASAAENFDVLSKWMNARMASGESTLGKGGLVLCHDDVVEALGLSDDDFVSAATWTKVYASPSAAAATLQKGRESHEALVLSYVTAAAKLASEPLEQMVAGQAVAAAERARDVSLGNVGFFGSIAQAVARGIENAQASSAASASSATVNPFRTSTAVGGPITKAQSPSP